jgi:threonine/homoserine/homoserine lactone efflux protein
MGFIFFIKGMIIGFALAVPIGPIGIMCIRNTITEGRSHGLMVGLGGATSDLLYSSIAAFGITSISNIIDHHRFWIRLSGGAFLLFMGMITYYSRPRERKIVMRSKAMMKSFFFTMLLAFTNPLTIFAFIAVFATLGIGHAHDFFYLWTLAIGVFTGSFGWFLLISSCANYYGVKFNRIILPKINKITGILIVISGAIAIVSVI